MNEEIKNLKKVGNWISAILLGNTREIIARIDERTIMMLEDLKDIKPKVNDMYPKVDILWKDEFAPANSPRQLNERGNLILEKSGIKEVIDSKKEVLLKVIKEKNNTNPYDTEATILSVVADLANYCPDVIEKLKTGAFNSGASMSSVLLVGGIYLRDLIFPELGFKVEELDKPKI